MGATQKWKFEIPRDWRQFEQQGPWAGSFLKKISLGAALVLRAALPKLGRSTIETLYTSCTNELA
jgi:hypothetical protein